MNKLEKSVLVRIDIESLLDAFDAATEASSDTATAQGIWNWLVLRAPYRDQGVGRTVLIPKSYIASDDDQPPALEWLVSNSGLVDDADDLLISY